VTATADATAVSPVLAAALDGLARGLSMVIIRAIGEPWYEYDDATGQRTRRLDGKTGEPAVYGPKIPCGRWKPYQDKQAPAAELRKYATDPEWGPKRGVAVVTGFDGIDSLDFDDVPTWERFEKAAAADPVLSAILERVAAGYFELSPRGAPHLLYRCDDLTDGGPLARRPVIVEGPDGRQELKVLIETRGPGQIIVIAPTPGSCHPSGRPYVLQRGGLATIATITPDERRKLFALARTFDEVPPLEPRDEPKAKTQTATGGAQDGEKPGAHFNRACTVEMWKGMLAEWNWTYIGAVSGREHCWVRPEASSSLSAHLHTSGNLLVLSTATKLKAWTKTDPTTHSPFAVYAEVNHKGDMSAAARELFAIGYGSRGPTITLNGKPLDKHHANGKATAEELNRKYPDRFKAAAPEPGDAEIPPEDRGDMPGDGEPKAESKYAPPPPPQDPRPGLPLLYYADVAPVLETADFVEGLLIDGAMSVVYGESNSGKTFWALDLSLYVADGAPWRGRSVDRRGVLYLALEGGHGIRNRVAAWRKHYGVAVAPFAVVPVQVNLLDPAADAVRVIEAAADAAEKLGRPVGLVVVDTLARAMAGGNENSPEDMGAFVRNVDLIRQTIPGHVQVIHHSGKDTAKGARGHSSLRAATDTEIEVTRDMVTGLSSARVTKQRDLPCDGEFTFRLESVELGHDRRGKPVTSCVVVEAEVPMREPTLPGDQQTALVILVELVAEQGQDGFAGTPAGTRSVPVGWWRDRVYERTKPGASQDTKQKAFRRAVDGLVEARKVAVRGDRVWLP
jgi:hypothetical protein